MEIKPDVVLPNKFFLSDIINSLSLLFIFLFKPRAAVPMWQCLTEQSDWGSVAPPAVRAASWDTGIPDVAAEVRGQRSFIAVLGPSGLIPWSPLPFTVHPAVVCCPELERMNILIHFSFYLFHFIFCTWISSAKLLGTDEPFCSFLNVCLHNFSRFGLYLTGSHSKFYNVMIFLFCD